jgi:hypothetical protein
MQERLVLIVVLACCLPVPAATGFDCSQELSPKEWDSIVDAWREDAGEFIYHVWRIARTDVSQEERQRRYDACTKKLVSKARELRIRTASLMPLAQTCIEEEENHRKPPAGWDPDDTKGNLTVFSNRAATMVQIHLQLMAYGRRHCKSDRSRE